VGGKLTSPPSVSILHETTSLAPFTTPIACFVFLFLSTSALAQHTQIQKAGITLLTLLVSPSYEHTVYIA
jgi:hypothetical protein